MIYLVTASSLVWCFLTAAMSRRCRSPWQLTWPWAEGVGLRGLELSNSMVLGGGAQWPWRDHTTIFTVVAAKSKFSSVAFERLVIGCMHVVHAQECNIMICVHANIICVSFYVLVFVFNFLGGVMLVSQNIDPPTIEQFPLLWDCQVWC